MLGCDAKKYHVDTTGVKPNTGISTTKRPLHTDLDTLAGSWTADDIAEFERATAEFEHIDESLWR